MHVVLATIVELREDMNIAQLSVVAGVSPSQVLYMRVSATLEKEVDLVEVMA